MAETSLSSQTFNESIASNATATTFDKTWSPSKAAAFDISSLPLPKPHRAYERAPQSPKRKGSGYSKVWRRYGLRNGSRTSATNDVEIRNRHPDERAVKRLCLGDRSRLTDGADSDDEGAKYAGTKYDRRKSGSIRKIRPSEITAMNGVPEDSVGEADQQPKNAQTAQDNEEKSRTRRAADMENVSRAIRKRKSFGRHSLGANLTGRTPFIKESEETVHTDSINDMDALCLSPRNEAANCPTLTLTGIDEGTGSEQQAAASTSPTPSKSETPGSVATETPSEMDKTLRPSEDAANPVILLSSPHDPSIDDRNPATPETMQDDTESADEATDLIEVADAPIEEEKTAKDTTMVSGVDEQSNRASHDESPSLLGVPSIHLNDDTTTHLELDTALLKDFLSRTQAAKASKASDENKLSIERRSSLMNRRDSDIIKQALASPRVPLDDKDPNSPLPGSANKVLDLPGVKALAAQLPVAAIDAINSVDLDATSTDTSTTRATSAGPRRSTRTRSRLPAFSVGNSEKTPSKTISVKRTADGSDPTAVVIKKTEAQELSILTRANTRRNKGSAVVRQVRLKKLRTEGMAPAWVEGKVKDMPAINAAEKLIDSSADHDGSAFEQPWRILEDGEKGVRWRPNEELFSFFGNTSSIMDFGTSVSGATPGGEDTLTSVPPPSSRRVLSAAVLPAHTEIDSPKKAAPRLRRLRGLGAANGTPAKGFLSSALLPDEVAEEKEKGDERVNKKTKLPTAKERKSRIATPRKLKLTPVGLSASQNGTAEKDEKGAQEAKERRLASPRKISQFGVAAPAGGRGRKKT
ncbi:hypothetical protein NA57DRAFT_82296 [Rhizodiscina lignyota]|uniref:Uncharacterized protein n=1 Tax=Rhizodiscina lignyota TaxID=1504668 RepID=A0A9P4LZB2_9PEZI|nr:hypothetical protein NA57DRAFT_82296 [Rhizodiscina lignyota]